MIDEILLEVIAVKEALAEQSNYDIRRLAKEVRQSEIETALQGWHHVQTPATPLPFSAFQVTRFAKRPGFIKQ